MTPETHVPTSLKLGCAKLHKMRWILAAALLAPMVISAEESESRRERRFEFTYVAGIEVPEGTKRLDLWLPYPSPDQNQDIEVLGISAPFPTEIRKDSEHGNSIVYMRADNPGGQSVEVEMKFRVTRREYVRRDFALPDAAGSGGTDQDVKRWLEPDRLVPIDAYIKEQAEEVVDGRTGVLDKARAIYDYTVDNLKYDKSGTGWGRGDIYYACDVKRGNCTDFHAVFIGFARAVGIPAKFAIGFPLPADRESGQIAGYHCWAEFFLPGYGWVPVDTSEANKNPTQREYFFGAHDENRIEFTIGRDIILSPPQQGPPINFFIYPYVELDGKPATVNERRFFFRDIAKKTS